MEIKSVGGAATVIQCKYPFGYSIMLHPTLLIVNEPESSGQSLFAERTPLWKVTAVADATNPLFLTLRIKAPSPKSRTRPPNSKDFSRAPSDSLREAGFYFEDARSRTRAVQHCQESKERELKRLETQLVGFIDQVLQECEQGHVVRSLMSARSVKPA